MTQIEISSVSGVTVTIISADGTTKGTTITNASGEYSFHLGKNGNGDYKIELSKECYQAKIFSVTVTGETTAQDEYLAPKDEAPIVYSDIPIDEEHFPDATFRKYISRAIDKNSDGILSKDENKSTTTIDTRYIQD